MANRKNQNLVDDAQSYTHRIEEAPDDVLLYLYRGNVYFGLGNYAEAIADYSTFIARVTKDSQDHGQLRDAYQSRGTALYELGDIEGAIANATEAIAAFPTDVSLYEKRAILYQGQQRFTATIDDYTHMLTLKRSTDSMQCMSAILCGRANAYLLSGDYESALIDISQALEIENQDTNALAIRARIFTRIERYTEAVQDYTTIIELKQTSATPLDFYARAGVYLLMNRTDLALKDYQHIKEIFPAFPKIDELIEIYTS